MTTEDRAAGPPPGSRLPPAFFLADGDAFVPTALARGPWGQTISGMVTGGILGHVLERDVGDTDFQPTRLTVDLFRPAAMAPLTVETTIAREGKRLRLADAVVVQSDKVVARASALFLRRGEQPTDEVWTSEVTMPALPATPDPVPEDLSMMVWTYGKENHTPGPGFGLVAWEHAGPKYVWVRAIRPLVEGRPLTPFTHAAMAGDMASSLTHYGTGGLQFINADYTLTLSRLPEGHFLGLAALTHVSHAGVATGTATIVDEFGPIGTAVANALSNPGFDPPHP